MGISIFYFLALIPTVIAALLYIFDKEVVWFEWLIGTAIGFVLAAIFHISAVAGMTGDVETWSGWVETTTFHPFWVEHYYELVTHGSGKHSYTTLESRYRDHHEFWDTHTNLGQTIDVSHEKFIELARQLGPVRTYDGNKSGFSSGDPHLYIAQNENRAQIPVTDLRDWTNKVKASPSAFSYSKVPDNIKVYPWPKNEDVFQSDRLLGFTANIDRVEFDRMNSRLGAQKKVNVILIGFGMQDRSIADYQEAAWIGGKKNDLVITFGGKPEHPTWTHVFGWSESDLAKRNIESLLVTKGVSNYTMALVEKEIVANYHIKDWKKFDYLTVEPPTWTYPVFILVLTLIEVGFWWWALHNDINKESDGEDRIFSPTTYKKSRMWRYGSSYN